MDLAYPQEISTPSQCLMNQRSAKTLKINDLSIVMAKL